MKSSRGKLDPTHTSKCEQGHSDALGTAIISILSELEGLHRVLLPERESSDLEETFFKKSLGKYRSVEDLNREADQALALETYKDGKPLKKKDKEIASRLLLFWIACEHFTSAMYLRSEDKDSDYWHKEIEAWRHLLCAQKLVSFVLGRMSVQTVLQASMKGLEKTHTENRAMKKDVFEWLDRNRLENGQPNFKGKGRTMDATAELISRTIVTVVFRTARDYIAEWKKLRSTGRP